MDDVQLTVLVEPEIRSALESIRDGEGLLIKFQVRMALLMWLESKGIDPLKKPKK